MPDRASAPVTGVLLLVLTVVAGSAVAGVALGTLPESGESGLVPTALELDVAGDGVVLTHRAGHALDVRHLRVVVTVDGTPLRHQPPVPFFAATGFQSGPTGPFNVAADPTWTAGERAGFRIASTNAPAIRPGRSVTVEVYRAGTLVVRLSATATPRPAPPT